MADCKIIQPPPNRGIYHGAWIGDSLSPEEQLTELEAFINKLFGLGSISSSDKDRIIQFIRQNKGRLGNINTFRTLWKMIETAMERKLSRAEARKQKPRARSNLVNVYFGSIEAFERMAQEDLDIIVQFIGFNNLTFPTADSALLRQNEQDQALFLKLEPWDMSIEDEEARKKDQTYSLDKIAAGDFDTRITSFAQDVASNGRPIFISFAHEMNIPPVVGNRDIRWYPWQGNPEAYKKAYRHVVDLFKAAGADNVTWVWNVNVGYQNPDLYNPEKEKAEDGSYVYSVDENGSSLEGQYIHWVAVDGYDFAKPKHLSFDILFYETIRNVADLGRPILIGETATDSESLTGERNFLNGLFNALGKNSDLFAGFVVFQQNKWEDNSWKSWGIEYAQEVYRNRLAGLGLLLDSGITTASACTAPQVANPDYETSDPNSVINLGYFEGFSFQFQLEKLYKYYKEGQISKLELGKMLSYIFDNREDLFKYISYYSIEQGDSIHFANTAPFQIGNFNFHNYTVGNLRNLVILLIFYSQIAVEERDTDAIRKSMEFSSKLDKAINQYYGQGSFTYQPGGLFRIESYDPYWHGRLLLNLPTLLLQLPAEELMATLGVGPQDYDAADKKIRELLGDAYFDIQNSRFPNTPQGHIKDPFSRIKIYLLLGDLYMRFYELSHKTTYLNQAEKIYTQAFKTFRLEIGKYDRATRTYSITTRDFTYDLGDISLEIEANKNNPDHKKSIADVDIYLRAEALAREAGLLLPHLTAKREARGNSDGASFDALAFTERTEVPEIISHLPDLETVIDNMIVMQGLSSDRSLRQNTFFLWQAKMMQAEFLTTLANKAMLYPELTIPSITIDGQVLTNPTEFYEKARDLAGAVRSGSSSSYLKSRAAIKWVTLDMLLDITGENYKSQDYVTKRLAEVTAARASFMRTDSEYLEATLLMARLQNLLANYKEAEAFTTYLIQQIDKGNIDIKWDPYLRAMVYFEHAKAISWGTNEDSPNKIDRYDKALGYFTKAEDILVKRKDGAKSCYWIEVSPPTLSELYYEIANAHVGKGWSYLDVEDKEAAAASFNQADKIFKTATKKSEDAITYIMDSKDSPTAKGTKIKLELLRLAQIGLTQAKIEPYRYPKLTKEELLKLILDSTTEIYSALKKLLLVATATRRELRDEKKREELIQAINQPNTPNPKEITPEELEALLAEIEDRGLLNYSSILTGVYDFGSRFAIVWLKLRDLREEKRNAFLAKNGLNEDDVVKFLENATSVFVRLDPWVKKNQNRTFKDYITKLPDLYARVIYQQVLLSSVVLVDYGGEEDFGTIYKPILTSLLGEITDQDYESTAFDRMLDLINGALDDENGLPLKNVRETTRSILEALKGEILFMRAFRRKDKALKAEKPAIKAQTAGDMDKYQELHAAYEGFISDYISDAEEALSYLTNSIDKAEKSLRGTFNRDNTAIHRKWVKSKLLKIRLLAALAGDVDMPGIREIVARQEELQGITIRGLDLEEDEYRILEKLYAEVTGLIIPGQEVLNSEIEAVTFEVVARLAMISKERKDLGDFGAWLEIIRQTHQSFREKVSKENSEITNLTVQTANLYLGKLFQSLASEINIPEATDFVFKMSGITKEGKSPIEYEKEVLEHTYEKLLKPGEAILRSTSRQDLWRAMGENLARRAFIAKELGDEEEYQSLAKEALQKLSAVLEKTRNQFIKTEAEMWIAKILMSLLADKKTALVEHMIVKSLEDIFEPSVLENIFGTSSKINIKSLTNEYLVLKLLDDELLRPVLSGEELPNPALLVFKTKMLADAKRTLGENLARQAFLLKDLDQEYDHLLAEAQIYLKEAALSGDKKTRIAAHIWLAKIKKVQISDAILNLRDKHEFDELRQKAAEIDEVIATHLSPMLELVEDNTFQYQELQLTWAELLVQKAYLHKDLDEFEEFEKSMEEALPKLLETMQKGNLQTRAEAMGLLVGHIVGIASETEYAKPLLEELGVNTADMPAQEIELALLEKAWLFINESFQLVDFKGGQRRQFLKYTFETGSRLSLAYRDLGYVDDWEKMDRFMFELEEVTKTEDPEVLATASYWLGNIRFARSTGKKKDLTEAQKYFKKALSVLEGGKSTYLSRYGEYAYNRLRREIYLALAKVMASKRKIEPAIEKLKQAEAMVPPAQFQNEDDKRFLARVCVEKADLYSWGKKQYKEAEDLANTGIDTLDSLSLPLNPQLQALRWRAQIILADILWVDDRNFKAAQKAYKAIILGIQAEEILTVTTKLLLAKAQHGLQQVLRMSGIHRDIRGSREEGKEARDITGGIPYTNREITRQKQAIEGALEETAPARAYFSVDRYQDRVVDPESEEMAEEVPPDFSQQETLGGDIALLRKYAIENKSPFEIRMSLEGSRTHGVTSSKGSYEVPSATVGISADFGGMAKAEFLQTLTPDNASDTLEYYFKGFHQQFNVRLDAYPLWRFMPLDADFSLNLVDGKPQSWFGQAAFHPSRYLDWLRYRGTDFSVGAKIDAQPIYSETAITLDFKQQFQILGRTQTVGFGFDIPFTDRLDTPDFRLGMQWRFPAGFFLNIDGEISNKRIPIYYDSVYPTETETLRSKPYLDHFAPYRGYYGSFTFGRDF